MSGQAAKSVHEPDQRDDPLNGLLDAVEVLVSTAKGSPAEAALRARLERLLPAPCTLRAPGSPPGNRLPAGQSPGEPKMPGARQMDIDRALKLASAASLLERVARRCRSEAERGAASAARAVLLDELDAMRTRGEPGRDAA